MRGGLFPVVEGPCKRYAMARHVYQAAATTTSRPGGGRRRCVSPEADRMNKMRGATGGWQCRP